MPKKKPDEKAVASDASTNKKEKKEKQPKQPRQKKPKKVKVAISEAEQDGAYIARLMDSKEPDLEEPEPVFPESAMGRTGDGPAEISGSTPELEPADAGILQEDIEAAGPAEHIDTTPVEEPENISSSDKNDDVSEDDLSRESSVSDEEAPAIGDADSGSPVTAKIVEEAENFSAEAAAEAEKYAEAASNTEEAPAGSGQNESDANEPAPDKPAFTRKEIAKAWWQAARPPFYIATVIPLVLGFLVAENAVGYYDWVIFCGALLICFALHLCSNLGNDLFDHFQGTDTQDSIGGSRVLQEGKITVRQLAMATAGGYAFALVFTIAGVWFTGLKGLWLIVLFGMFSSYFYVAPPIKYGYRALGELFVFLNMGVTMVAGVYYGICGEVSTQVIAMSVPIGLMVAGILYFQSLPEIESDKLMGKRTLANTLGPEKAFFLFKLWWPGIWALMAMLYLSGVCAWPVLPGIALCLPVHLKACKKVDSVEEGDWFSLDRYGKFVRLEYLICGLFLIISVGMM